MNYTSGRRVVPLAAQPRRVCDMIRKHMADHDLSHEALSQAWNVSRSTVSTTLSRHKKRPLPAHYIAAAVRVMQLDDFDATELYRAAALEAGYLIDGPTL